MPERRDVAMTGEITLRGKVLPIGGVKEKVLAAHRAGMKTIILPKDNEKDLADIPKNVLDALTSTWCETMDEVLKIALAEPLPGAAWRRRWPKPSRWTRATTRLRTEERAGSDCRLRASRASRTRSALRAEPAGLQPRQPVAF